MERGVDMSTKIYGVKGEDGRRLSRPLLRLAARKYGWGELPELEYSDRGKPLIPGEGRWLSLSHSGGYALCALSECPVGVDIELVKPHRPGLPAFCFAEEEMPLFDGTDGSFTRLWTLKESFCKLGDTPLYPPRKVPVPPPCPHKSYQGEGWWASVCCQDTPPEGIEWVNLEDLVEVFTTP